MINCRGDRAVTIGVALWMCSVSWAETPDEIRNRVLTQTELVAVADLVVPAAEYKGDGDPNTLEIVLLEKKADGPSRVTEDGEVIFLYKASDKTQQKLIQQAFEIRIARALGGT
jgi:hypothetical protein